MKTDNPKGKLYLIPTTLGENDPVDVLPQTVKRAIDFIDHYIVENEKTARRFIKAVNAQKVQAELKISLLNKHTEVSEHNAMIKPCLEGINVGLMKRSRLSGCSRSGRCNSKNSTRKRYSGCTFGWSFFHPTGHDGFRHERTKLCFQRLFTH